MDFLTPSQSTLFVTEILLWITGIGAAIGKVLFWTGIIRIKRYRMNRFIDFLGTKQGTGLLIHPVGISDTVLALCLVVLLQFYDNTHALWHQFVLASIVIYVTHIAWYYYATKPQHRFHIQSIAIIITTLGLSLITVMMLYAYFPLPLVVDVALLQVALPLFGLGTTAIISSIIGLSERLAITKARSRVNTIQPIVIAISGTHARATTRAVLEKILTTSYAVLSIDSKLDESLAETVLNQLSSNHQILLYEMDPLSPQDVAMSLSIAPPIALVIPTIEESYTHIPFIDQTQFSKTYIQMLENLPNNGLLILDADNPKSSVLAQYGAARIKYFSMKSVAHAYLRHATLQSESIDCDISVGSEKTSLHIPAIGTEPIAAILASSIVANHLGVSLPTISHAIESLQTPQGATHVGYGVNHAFIIDGTALSSEAEIRSIIDYASIHRTKEKILLIDADQHALWDMTLPLCTEIIDEYIFIGLNGNTARDFCTTTYNIEPNQIHLFTSSQKACAALRASMTPQHAIIAIGPLPVNIRKTIHTP